MKKLMLLLIFVTTPVFAEWTYLFSNVTDDKYYIDFKTLKKGKTSKAWFLSDYAEVTDTGTHSAKILYEANCYEEKIRYLAMVFYEEPMGGGLNLSSIDTPQPWKYATPESINASIINVLCKKAR